MVFSGAQSKASGILFAVPIRVPFRYSDAVPAGVPRPWWVMTTCVHWLAVKGGFLWTTRRLLKTGFLSGGASVGFQAFSAPKTPRRKCGVVVVLIGELEGVAEAGREILVRVETEPEGDGAGGEVDVFRGFEVDGVFVFCLEAKGSGAIAARAGGEDDVGGGGKAGLAGGVAFVGGSGEELGVAFGNGGFAILFEGGMEEQSVGQGGEGKSQ